MISPPAAFDETSKTEDTAGTKRRGTDREEWISFLKGAAVTLALVAVGGFFGKIQQLLSFFRALFFIRTERKALAGSAGAEHCRAGSVLFPVDDLHAFILIFSLLSRSIPPATVYKRDRREIEQELRENKAVYDGKTPLSKVKM
jgi:hypothetical protein